MSIYSWDLTAANNATADAQINWSEGQSPSTVNNSARAMMSATKAAFNDMAGVSILGGTGDTFTLTLSQPMVSLTNAVVGFFATRANSGAVTLNVDGLGAKPLRLVSGVALTAAQIVNGTFYHCGYNPSTQEWLIVGKYALSNADLPAMAANTVKANLTGGSATPTDVPIATLGAALGPSIPSGLISMWSGSVASVPSGWYLCDGTNGTPDLRNKFIIGATADSGGISQTTVTGSNSKSGGTKDATAIAHTHTGATTSGGAHNHDPLVIGGGNGTTTNYAGPGGAFASTPFTIASTSSTGWLTTSGAHTHSFVTDSTGSDGTNQNLPPYFALAFIMKS